MPDKTPPAADLQQQITKLKEISAQQQALLDAVLKGFGVGIVIVDWRGRPVTFNQDFEGLLGYDADELRAMSFRDFTHPDDVDENMTLFYQLLHGEIVRYQYEKRYICKDGDVIWVRVNVSRLANDEDGHPQIMSLIEDITERKLVEFALETRDEESRQFQEKLRALHRATMELSKVNSQDELSRKAIEYGRDLLHFDRASIWYFSDDAKLAVGAFGVDEQGHIRDERAMRYSIQGSMVHKRFLKGGDLFSVFEDTPLYNDREQIVGRGWQVVAMLYEGARKIGWLNVDNLVSQEPLTPHRLEIIRLYAVTLATLLVQMRAKEALVRSEESWRTLVQNAPNIIALVDREHRIKFINRELELSQQEVLGQKIEDLMLPEYQSLISKQLDLAFETGQPTSYESTPADQASSQQWFHTHVGPIIHEGKVTELVLITQNITERHAMEHERIELAVEREKTRLLTNFITDASHEFRTPLSIINSSLYMAQRVEADRQPQYFDQINQQVDNLTTLLQGLITMSRLDSGKELTFVEIDVNSLVLQAVSALYATIETKHIDMQVTVKESKLLLSASVDQLHRAIYNIVDNAIRHSDDDGIVQVRTDIKHNNIIIEVQDYGEGISKEALPRIFDRFFRVDSAHSTPGFGLGLSIARRIVELHSGAIQVESTAGQGSTFRIILPMNLMSQSAG